MPDAERVGLTGEEQAFFSAAEAYLKARFELRQEPTTQGMFSLLLEQGMQARKEGNYGIAASVVVSGNGYDVIVFGRNSLISEENPHGHAEMNAVKNARAIMQDPSLMAQYVAEGRAIIRPNAASVEFKKTIYTTLEPCPMCTVGACINGGVNEVIMGVPDDFAGGLAPDRLANLAPLWKQIADGQGLAVTFCQNEDEHAPNYIPVELQQHLLNLFFQTREKLDDHLKEHGFIDFSKLLMIAVGFMAQAENNSAGNLAIDQ